MNTLILDIICCPNDNGELSLSQIKSGKGVMIKDGILKCLSCKREFPIINGIPVLLNEVSNLEVSFRDRIYSAIEGETFDTLIKHVEKHHYVAMMKREAVSFSHHFEDRDFILDLGSGWCWPWHKITSPHIICADFSYEALSKGAKMLSDQVDSNIHLICADFMKLPIKNSSLMGTWSSRALYVRDNNKDEIIKIFDILKNKLISQNVFLVFDNFPYIINYIYKIFGKKMSTKIEFGSFFAKRISWRELAPLVSVFTACNQVRYNEIIYNHDLRLVHNLPLTLFDELLGLLPLINAGFARQIIFECYE